MGREASEFYKRLTDRLSVKRDKIYSMTMIGFVVASILPYCAQPFHTLGSRRLGLWKDGVIRSLLSEGRCIQYHLKLSFSQSYSTKLSDKKNMFC